MPPEFRQQIERLSQEVNDALNNEQQVIEECVNCGCSVDEDQVVHNESDEAHCDDCYYERHFNCGSCGDETDVSDEVSADGMSLCQECFDDNYDYCSNCDEALHRDDMVWNDHEEAYQCEHCYEENSSLVEWEVMSNDYVKTRSDFITPLTSGYSMHKGRLIKQTDPNMLSIENRRHKKATKWMKDSHDVIKSKRLVGLELEINLDSGYYDYEDDYQDDIHYLLTSRLCQSRHVLSAFKTRQYPLYMQGNMGYTIVGDSSVTSSNHPFGCEVVTAPRRGDIIVADINTMCKTLKDDAHAYISQNCGLHLHVDTSDFDYKHFTILTALTKLIEPHVYTWLPSSRRNSRWSQPITQDYNQLKNVYDRDDFVDVWYDGNNYYPEKYHDKRYHGLNLHSHFYAKQGSEIRYHSGTLNADKIKHWVIFWTQVFDTAYDIAERIDTPLSSSSFFQSLVGQDKIVLTDRERKILSNYRRHELSLSDYTSVKSDPELWILYRKLRDYHGLSTDVSLFAIVYGYHYMNPWYQRQDKSLTFDSMMDLFDIPKSTRDFYYKRYYNRRNDEYFDHNHLKRCYGKVDEWYSYDKRTGEFTLVDDTRSRLVHWQQLNSRRPKSNRAWRYVFSEHEVKEHICRLVNEYVNHTSNMYAKSVIQYSDADNEAIDLRREWLEEQYRRIEPAMPLF